MRSTTIRGLFLSCMVVVAVFAQAQPVAAAPGPSVASACGEPLDAAEVSEVIALSDLDTLPTGPSMPRLEATAERLRAVTEILARHKDRRASFALGLDALEQFSVLPLQRRESAFDDPDYAHRLSIEVMRQFLVNLHGEFASGPVEPRWARHFELARDCDVSIGRVTMAGYNAHFSMDMPHAVAAIGSAPANRRDYFTVLDTIARDRHVIVAPTEAVFGAAVRPPLERLAGNGLVGLGFTNVNALNFANGLALRSRILNGVTEAQITLVWRAIDTAVQVL